MAKINWTLRTFNLAELTDYYKNPRSLSEKEFKQLKTSLDKFGMIDKPIVNLDSANTIIGGHQRKHVLEASGVKECECWVPDRELSEKEVEELNIRLNKNTGSWDFDTLANEFELDDLLDWGFDKDKLLQDSFTYKLSEYSVIRKPEALTLNGLFGCYAACRWDKTKSDDYKDLLEWKSNPSGLKRKTIEMAEDLAKIIDFWARGWRGFVITAPPQGCSFGREYPAGILAKEVSNILCVDYVTIFKEWGDGYKSHHPAQSLLRTDPPMVITMPELPILIVDDLVTSGNTAKLSLEALRPHPCWFFAWISNHRTGIKLSD